MADNKASGDSGADGDDQEGANQKGGDQKDGGEDKQEQEKEQARDAARAKSKPWVRLGLVIFVLVVLIGGFFFWWTTRFEESTDDAFTEGRQITVSPHVSGYVIELDVNDNQFVHQGQILMRIDPRDFQANRDAAQAAADEAQGQLEGAKYSAEVAKQNYPGQLKAAQGQLLVAQGNAFQAETEFKRQHNITRAATTQQAIDQSTAQLKQAEGQLLEAEGRVEQNTPVESNVKTAGTRVSQQAGALAQSKAQLATAGLNLGWTVIRAPHDGWIAQRNVERGNYVQAGQSLFSIVEPDVWIIGNFKETQLSAMRPGQPVKISIDAYPRLKLSGHVDSIQNGSGAQFSAFPPENATGNFVKIVQRVPVKIIIDDGLDPNLPLPLGLSVEPTVNIK